jgi:hypothetical protein
MPVDILRASNDLRPFISSDTDSDSDDDIPVDSRVARGGLWPTTPVANSSESDRDTPCRDLIRR